FPLGHQIGGPIAGTNFYSARDVFSWTKGNHSLKLGGEISLNKDIQQTLLNNYGVFTFNRNSTQHTAHPRAPGTLWRISLSAFRARSHRTHRLRATPILGITPSSRRMIFGSAL